MRAIAALSVALFHFTNHVNVDTPLIASEATRNSFVYGAQGVEMFYLISGFIIPYSFYYGKYQLSDYFSYLGKRLSRLLPPYFLTIFLITLSSYLLFYLCVATTL
jgi:peptidoglycan/LPS O-acetylase OafA/YrhL